jgi:hypothetical protein
MALKDHPIVSVLIEKILQDTGVPGRPFYSKVSETKSIRFFGVLVKKITTIGNFPEQDSKK